MRNSGVNWLINGALNQRYNCQSSSASLPNGHHSNCRHDKHSNDHSNSCANQRSCIVQRRWRERRLRSRCSVDLEPSTSMHGAKAIRHNASVPSGVWFRAIADDQPAWIRINARTILRRIIQNGKFGEVNLTQWKTQHNVKKTTSKLNELQM